MNGWRAGDKSKNLVTWGILKYLEKIERQKRNESQANDCPPNLGMLTPRLCSSNPTQSSKPGPLFPGELWNTWREEVSLETEV